MPINAILPLLLLSGLSSGKEGIGTFGDFECDECFIECLPRQHQQMLWQLRKLSFITSECNSLLSPPPCENAPDSLDASFSQIIGCMSDCISPTMQILSLFKTIQQRQNNTNGSDAIPHRFHNHSSDND